MKKILLTGSSGKLGQTIKNSGLFPPLLTPSHSTLDLTKPLTLETYFKENEFDAIIHCAALARMAECETNPVQAIHTNLIGTGHLVKETLLRESGSSSTIRFIHISTDGVYPGTRGRYSEKDGVLPYNRYGWTKLGAECAVNLLSNFCIIRTNFFDPTNIRFSQSAVDIYNSKISLDELVKAIKTLLESDFVGTLNIGSERESDYTRYKKFKPEITSCRQEEIFKTTPVKIASDSSLDISLWETMSRRNSRSVTPHQ